MASCADDSEEENILYDVLVHEEWPQESELLVKAIKERPRGSVVGRFASVAERSLWTFVRSVGYPLRSTTSCTLPNGLVQLVNNQINWQIAVSSDSRLIAILQDTCIEIRSHRDEYASIVGKCTVSVCKDPYPQWRKVTWNRDSTMIGFSDSSGNVQVFDVVGSLLCTIPKDETYMHTVPLDINVPIDLSCAIASLIFVEYKPNQQWSAKLLVINYQGFLRSYFVSPTGGSERSHTFLFTHLYPRGVCSVVYNQKHAMLIVGGCCGDPGTGIEETQLSMATQSGITAWRILSGLPHYKLITDYSEELSRTSSKIGFLRRIRTFKGSNKQDGVFKMCLSPDGCLLATLHHSGQIALWDMPSMNQQKVWEQYEQPASSEDKPVYIRPIKQKHKKENPWKHNLIDVNFWSNEALILARCSGALTVSSAKTLQNLLGESCEWFEPSPHVTARYEKGFLALECESKQVSLKRRRRETDDETDAVESFRAFDEDSDEDEDITMVSRSTRYVKQMLHFVTDFERFQPPRKKPKVIERTYRLVTLRETTPEELYTRKIDLEEYGEALALAKKYKLDCDMVYQRQWRKSSVSIASIQDYLSKITKRSWVLHECLERVPEDIDAAKELLQYGLRGTDLEALIAIGKGQDKGRFIFCADYDDVYEDIDEDPDSRESREDLIQRRKQEMLQEVNFNNLNLEQKELCRSRTKLLTYLDRLSTYEVILGGPSAAEEHFDHSFFRKFRSQNIVETAVEYSQDGDWRALDAIFTYHGRYTSLHRLAILGNFPETMSPFEYRDLLPEGGLLEDNTNVLNWEYPSRNKDWCEEDFCTSQINPHPEDYGAFLYEENPHLDKYRTTNPSDKLLTEWYKFRACEIEQFSRQVDNALELINLGIERNISDLNDLHTDLVTMETLVYECGTEPAITFEEFRELSDIEKLQMLMAKPTKDMYIKNVRQWLVPFLQRCDRKKQGSAQTLLRLYLVSMAKDDLTFPVMIFENSRPDKPDAIIRDVQQVFSIAIECIYNCERDDQLNLAWTLFQSLPQKGYGLISEELTRLHQQIDLLECHLVVAGILEDNNLPKTAHFIRDTQHNAEEAKQLLVKLTRSAGRREPPLKKSGWEKLRKSILQIQKKVYNCIDEQTCYEIFTESLLCSGRLENIKLAGDLMDRGMDELDGAGSSRLMMLNEIKVPYDRSVELVLNAAMEYFNSSSNLTDPCMELAKACLHLIADVPATIRAELDLIEALQLLSNYDVKILPLQVRLCEDKIELIKKSLLSSHSTYKNAPKLLQLAMLLRVSGDDIDDRNGRVLVLIAMAALQAHDYRVAHDTCSDLMSQYYHPAWRVCKQLGECEEFKDLTARRCLLSYAVTYCDDDVIESLMNSRSLLETQILYQTVDIHMDVGKQQEETPEQLERDSHQTALQKTRAMTREVLANTTVTTKAVLATVSDKQWWKDTLNWMRPLSQVAIETDDGDRNIEMEKQGCHPFYETVIKNAHVSKMDINYSKFATVQPIEDTVKFLSHALLRTGKCEETRTSGELVQPATQVLLELAKDCVFEDMSLLLGYLLALPESLDAEHILEKLPRTAVCLQFAAYYYALQIYTALNPYQGSKVNDLYLQSPNEVIDVVISHVTSQATPDWSDSVTLLIPKLQLYVELLADFMQAEMLQNLGRGVDVARFTQDNEYKHETIVGLAMSEEVDAFEISVSLAKRYNLSIWEVYMTHLEYLFSDSGLTTKEIEKRCKDLDILPTLVENSSDFCQRCKTYIYTSIEGENHNRLLFYYTLIGQCDDSDITDIIKPDTHIKLLKKLKPSMPGLDYKSLFDVEKDPFEVIKPVLQGSNVHVIAKLANKIPDQLRGGFLVPSSMFCLYVNKLFWEGEQSAKKVPQSTADWLHRYEACGEYLQRLIPSDLILFFDGITFTEEAFVKLTVDCRVDIIKRALKYVKQQSGKKKQTTETEANYESVIQYLRQSQRHLDTFNSAFIKDLMNSQDGKDQEYMKAYDLSRGDQEKLKLLAKKMVVDGVAVETIHQLVELSPIEKWRTLKAYHESIEYIISLFRGESATGTLSDHEPYTLLEKVIQSVSDHIQQDGRIVTSDDIISQLRPFCADMNVELQPRMDVLLLLEKSFELTGDDHQLLLYYRTDAVIATAWNNYKLCLDDIKTDDGRQIVFESLLKISNTMKQLECLSTLLQSWPSLESMTQFSTDPVNHPWVQLLVAMVTCKEEKNSGCEVYTTLTIIQPSEPLSKECIEHIYFLMVHEKQLLCAMKIILLSDYVDLYPACIHLMYHHHDKSDPFGPKSYDDELFQLVLEKKIGAKIVNTPYYPALFEYLQTNQDEITRSYVEQLANQLQEAGYESEAGSLLLLYRGTHPALRTLDAALGAITKWFNK